ncbi:MAG TPA: hypothetical protein VKY24_02070 [Reyranella sp.]|nr:hypothetical protein [Reyranella sp.]
MAPKPLTSVLAAEPPLETSIKPASVVLVAEPPLLMTITPLLATVVKFASAPLNKFSSPSDRTLVPLVVPEETFSAPPTVMPKARPPFSTVAEPPKETNVPIAEPLLAIFWNPPADICVPVVMPPLWTICCPLFAMMELLAKPPEEMVSVPAWISVPETTPKTVSEPPLLTVMALAVPPDWTVSVSPLLIVSPLLVCPDETTNVAMPHPSGDRAISEPPAH